ncbi:nicotinamide riboside transporter PnuC [Pedobacter antarcticus]|nr:nicotinamide riboside transporter PnuC [Pedobacter antarcticus]
MLITWDSIMHGTVVFLKHTGWLEGCGVITGLICVWLAARNHLLNWPFAIISVSIYIFICFRSKLYADMGLQFYFLLMNIYGWYFWLKKRNDGDKSMPVHQISNRDIRFSVLAVLAFTLIAGYLLKTHTDAKLPFMDSFCTGCSLVAQWLLARRVLQNWLIWVAVDILYTGVYLSRELYATAFMYLIYIGIAWMGYIQWKKSFLLQQENPEPTPETQ